MTEQKPYGYDPVEQARELLNGLSEAKNKSSGLIMICQMLLVFYAFFKTTESEDEAQRKACTFALTYGEEIGKRGEKQA